MFDLHLHNSHRTDCAQLYFTNPKFPRSAITLIADPNKRFFSALMND